MEINERALTQNVDTLRNMLHGARFCGVVKANAYGHGLKETALILGRANVDSFAVDNLEDAVFLRSLFPSAQIITLGYVPSEYFDEVIEHDIEITLYDREGIEAAETVAAKRARKISFHAKIETGTSRQGILESDAANIFRLVTSSKHVELVGLSTHFANIEDTADPSYATQQYATFQRVCALASEHGLQPPHIHCACSAAIIMYPDTHGTLARAGIATYGLWSSSTLEHTVRSKSLPYTLQPALSWKSRIAQVKSLGVGTPIGYGLTEVLKKRSRVAVVPVGYWDGYDRLLSSAAEVLVKGYRCKVLGRVCMNMMMVDVSDVPQVEKDQVVTLLGTDGRHTITAEELARHARTINYEIVTRINPSLPRIIV